MAGSLLQLPRGEDLEPAAPASGPGDGVRGRSLGGDGDSCGGGFWRRLPSDGDEDVEGAAAEAAAAAAAAPRPWRALSDADRGTGRESLGWQVEEDPTPPPAFAAAPAPSCGEEGADRGLLGGEATRPGVISGKGGRNGAIMGMGWNGISGIERYAMLL